MIISASRRTDIPAFYSKWFMNRIKDGYVLVQNPYNTKQIRKVFLTPFQVDAIVFWTRNAKPLIPYLDDLDKLGYNYYFQYTITGYKRELERFTPSPQKAIENFIELSNKIGKEKVIWRYDPIILSDYSSYNEHLRLFEKISNMLENKTDKVVISFADSYKKITNNLKNIGYKDILENKKELYLFCEELSNIVKDRNIQIETCTEEIDLSIFGINPTKCIDDKLIDKLFNKNLSAVKDKNQRQECGCVQSIDIGMYNTCSHGCVYCYATFSDNTVRKNKALHNPDSPLLIGNFKDLDEDIKNKLNLEQRSLF